MIQKAISTLVESVDLTPSESRECMTEIVSGIASPAQIAAFLTALRMKGEKSHEIASFAAVMREHSIAVRPKVTEMLVDTCGTGGDGTNTFNISTTAAFVAAGAGIPIVKHGNRSVSSRCGSADVLEELGVNILIPLEKIVEIIDTLRIAFLFAPAHHPAMKYAALPRREIGIRSVFNLLGPLSNPAGAQAQLLGVYHPSLTVKLAEVLRMLGLKRAMVVYGSGMDEITSTGETRVSELLGADLRTYYIRCEDFGMERADPDDLLGGDPPENARIMLEVLEGERGPARDIVVLNAAAAIYLGGKAREMHEGVALASYSIDSGSAFGKLGGLIAATRTDA